MIILPIKPVTLVVFPYLFGTSPTHLTQNLEVI